MHNSLQNRHYQAGRPNLLAVHSTASMTAGEVPEQLHAVIWCSTSQPTPSQRCEFPCALT